MKYQAATLLLSASTALAAVNLRFPYGRQAVRGVNLGGWLVLEPWITPSIFDATNNASVVDEWTLGEQRYRGYDTAGVLKRHWDSFYSQSDFQAMKNAGLNHVRIPIGFWAFDVRAGEPYVTGQYPYLQKAVQWAANTGIKVLIDIHGVPGSQNGFDNSGHLGPTLWPNDQTNIDRTKAIITTLAKEFSKDQYANSVVAIQPVNEPASFKNNLILDTSKSLYQWAYTVLRKPFASNTTGTLLLFMHDAFAGFDTWKNFMNYNQGYEGVMLDTHSYSVFSVPELKFSWSQHIADKCSLGNTIYNYQVSNIWTNVGEWSLASTDCAKYLNGRGKGARYDGTNPDNTTPIGFCGNKTGTADKFSASYKVFLRKWYEAQTSAYEQGQGWFFWTWKTEGAAAADWDYSAGLKGGWIPYNPAEKKYGDQCGYNGRSGISKRGLPSISAGAGSQDAVASGKRSHRKSRSRDRYGSGLGANADAHHAHAS